MKMLLADAIKAVKTRIFKALDKKASEITHDEPTLKLKVFVGEHFVERLFERFPWPLYPNLIKEIVEWFDKEYVMLLYEANVDPEGITHKVCELPHGTIVVTFFNKTITLKTCYS